MSFNLLLNDCFSIFLYLRNKFYIVLKFLRLKFNLKTFNIFNIVSERTTKFTQFEYIGKHHSMRL